MADGGMSEWFRAGTLAGRPARGPRRRRARVWWSPPRWRGTPSVSPAPDPAQRVAVVGGGAIGLMAVAAARAMGAEEVALEARYPHQIELGERLGATQPTGLYDVVIEAAGSESALHRAAELAAPGGAMGVLGVFPPEVQWPQMLCFMKEVRSVPASDTASTRAVATSTTPLSSWRRRPTSSTRSSPTASRSKMHPRRSGWPATRRPERCASSWSRTRMSSNVMNHLGQCVTDLERSRTFYEEALGFTYWRTLELDDSPSDQLLQLQAPLGFRACT